LLPIADRMFIATWQTQSKQAARKLLEILVCRPVDQGRLHASGLVGPRKAELFRRLPKLESYRIGPKNWANLRPLTGICSKKSWANLQLFGPTL
jgi:hypothetical protein